MAMTKEDFDSTRMHQAMLDGLTDMIRKRLRERILESIEPDLKAAIDSAMDSLKTTIETWRSPADMRDTIKVLVEHKTPVMANNSGEVKENVR